MYHNYSDPTYYVKAHTSKMINEAAQARQAQEFKATSDTSSDNQSGKKGGLSSLWSGRASTVTPAVYLSVRN